MMSALPLEYVVIVNWTKQKNKWRHLRKLAKLTEYFNQSFSNIKVHEPKQDSKLVLLLFILFKVEQWCDCAIR